MTEVFHQAFLIPLLWVALTRAREPAYWWLAAAYGVSWLADWGPHVGMDGWTVSAVYPITQAVLVAAVLYGWRGALILLTVLLPVALLSAWMRQFDQPEVWLRIVAWGSAIGLAAKLPANPLRLALYVTFGGGLATWLLFALGPSWPTYLLYHLTWVVGMICFCAAVATPRPIVRRI